MITLDSELSEELMSDMQQQAEQIHRECLTNHVKQADETPRMLVGNLIGKGHVNYVLMYNMLMGIHIVVRENALLCLTCPALVSDAFLGFRVLRHLLEEPRE